MINQGVMSFDILHLKKIILYYGLLSALITHNLIYLHHVVKQPTIKKLI